MKKAIIKAIKMALAALVLPCLVSCDGDQENLGVVYRDVNLDYEIHQVCSSDDISKLASNDLVIGVPIATSEGLYFDYPPYNCSQNIPALRIEVCPDKYRADSDLMLLIKEKNTAALSSGDKIVKYNCSRKD